jgi:Tfp pilus assembly protein PilF
MKIKKYGLATFYLTKALKYLERSEEKKISFPAGQTKIANPTDYVSNLVSQRHHEVTFNMGLALFKQTKYFEAFKCFEKVSLGPVSQNPKLWFYMGLCVLRLNQKLNKENPIS